MENREDLTKFEFSFDISKAPSETESQERIITGIASLEEPDRDNEIISMDAFRNAIPLFMTNPIIRYKHQEPIGTALDAQVVDKQFLIKAKIGKGFDPADKTWSLIEQGIIKTFSVGGKVKKRASEKTVDGKPSKIVDMELYEVSVVDIPSNRGSIFSAIAKSLEKQDKDEVAQGMFNKPYNELTDDEKAKVDEKLSAKSVEPEIQKPFADYADFDACVADQKKNGKDDESAAKICGHLKAETEGKSLSKDIGVGATNHDDKNNKKMVQMPETITKEAEPTKEVSEPITKMYSETEVADAVKKAVESQPVRKATLEDVSGVKETTVKPVELLTKDAYGEGTSYVDAQNGVDLRKDSSLTFKDAYANFQKATLTTTGGTGTAGYALIPVYVDPDIIDRTRREIPFIEMVPRKAVQGLTYDYNAITAMAAAVALNEDAALSDVTDTYSRTSVTIRYLYSVGRVTGPAIAASRGYVDKLNLEVQNRTLAMKRFEDYLSLSNQTAPNFGGIRGLVTTNTTALSGPLTIAAIRTEVAQCLDAGASKGSMVIVTTNTLANSLRGLLMDYQRYVNTTTLAWGIETMSFDGIPVIVDRYTDAGYFWILDMSVIFMAVLQDMVYEELAKTNDSVKFSLKMYEALVIRAEAFCSGLSGCT